LSPPEGSIHAGALLFPEVDKGGHRGFNVRPMTSNPPGILKAIWLVLAMTFTTPVLSTDISPHPKATIEYSQDPGTVLVSFREVLTEFADQDPTPLIRIYGDGRVVVFHAAYMKQAGQYEMMMSRTELEALLLQLTPVLMDFNNEDVQSQKKAADELLWAAATDPEDLVLFHDSDADISVFHMNIDAYLPGGAQGITISKPKLDRSWRGLRFDSRDYLGIESIQDLMQAELSLRELTKRDELVLVESVP
jgi:hypothetical protein